MTEHEKEFYDLVTALEQSEQDYDKLKEELQRAPQYEKEDGRHTPTSIAAYKKSLQIQADLSESVAQALSAVEQATKALDKWIPQPVHERLDEGMCITCPTPNGFVFLLKDTKRKRYYIIRTKTQDEYANAVGDYRIANDIV